MSTSCRPYVFYSSKKDNTFFAFSWACKCKYHHLHLLSILIVQETILAEHFKHRHLAEQKTFPESPDIITLKLT